MGLVLLLCLAAGPAAGLDPAREIDQYATDAWGMAEGLPHRWIEAIVQTRDGYLWLGTQEGLVRFDGVRFTVFNRVNTEALRDNYVESLFESRDGALWIGVFGGGIVRMRGGVFQNLTEEIDPGQNEGAIRFAEGQDRRLWMLMPRSVLIARGAAGSISRWGPEEGFPSAEGAALLLSAAGEPWVGTAAGLVRLTSGAVERYGAA
jgi:ligand-binding sensor domain-containing protein